MSIENRKIGHYSICMSFNDNSTFNPEMFRDFLFGLMRLPREERLENNRHNNKALLISHVSETHIGDDYRIINVIFTSCKYNHAPDYMSSTDGSERATSKHRDEGEQELTHFSIELKADEGYIVFEERRSGVSIGIVIRYLNARFYLYQRDNGFNPLYNLEYALVPHDRFLDIVNRCERICSAELFVDKEILGSEFLNCSGYTAAIKDELVLSVKPHRSHSVDKPMIRRAFDSILNRVGNISRIRIKIKDDDGTVFLIDTLKGRRKNEVTVELNDNGIVNSTSMFRALEGVLSDQEEIG